jgi:hypothetical protein
MKRKKPFNPYYGWQSVFKEDATRFGNTPEPRPMSDDIIDPHVKLPIKSYYHPTKVHELSDPEDYVGVRYEHKEGGISIFTSFLIYHGVKINCGQYSTAKDAAIARDKMIIHLGLNQKLQVLKHK